ncbi:MAG: hypothetical protein LBP93_03205 [Treponema sp.]|jgi:hypothetical protein|nr:hypothetical protein [Treponema sp.]
MQGFLRKPVLIILFVCILKVPGFGETIAPFVMPSARSGALGGTHAALADDFYSLFTNPAAFVGVKEQFSAAEVTVSMYGPVFEAMDLAFDIAGSDLDSIDISGLVGPKGFAAGFDMGGPVSVGWIGRGLGFGLFNRTKTEVVLSGTSMRPLISEEILLVGGYSFRLLNNQSHVLDLGFLGKGFFRGAMDMAVSVFELEAIIRDPMDHLFKTQLGVGLDLGLRYTFASAFSVALVCYDVYSPALVSSYASLGAFFDKEDPVDARGYATVARRLDLGLMYRIRSPLLSRYISDFTIMVDYQNFLDFFALIPRNPVLNIGIGAEVVVLQALSLRVGIADALPAIGFGLDLSFMKIEFAIRGKELGLDPGMNPVYAVDLGLLFRY